MDEHDRANPAAAARPRAAMRLADATHVGAAR